MWEGPWCPDDSELPTSLIATEVAALGRSHITPFRMMCGISVARGELIRPLVSAQGKAISESRAAVWKPPLLVRC